MKFFLAVSLFFAFLTAGPSVQSWAKPHAGPGGGDNTAGQAPMVRGGGSQNSSGGTERYGEYEQFSASSSHGANYLLGHLIEVPRRCTLLKLAVIGMADGVSFKLALYTDRSGRPDRLVAVTGDEVLKKGPCEISVDKATLEAGSYWLMTLFEKEGSVGESDTENVTIKYIALDFDKTIPSRFPAKCETYSGKKHNYYIVTGQ